MDGERWRDLWEMRVELTVMWDWLDGKGREEQRSRWCSGSELDTWEVIKWKHLRERWDLPRPGAHSFAFTSDWNSLLLNCHSPSPHYRGDSDCPFSWECLFAWRPVWTLSLRLTMVPMWLAAHWTFSWCFCTHCLVHLAFPGGVLPVFPFRPDQKKDLENFKYASLSLKTERRFKVCFWNFSSFYLSPAFTNTENDACYYQEVFSYGKL